jgi:hypothetical protein
VWLQKDIGDWTINGDGGYWINPGSGNRNYWFFGSLLQRKITDQFKIGAEIFHQTRIQACRAETYAQASEEVWLSPRQAGHRRFEILCCRCQ